MNDLEIYSLIILALCACLFSWRLGVFISLAAGFLQDTLRKIVPGEPVHFTALVAVFILVTVVGAYLRGAHLGLHPVHVWNKVLRLPLNLFIALVFVQSIVAYINTDNPAIAGIGLAAYLMPLPGIMLGYRFSRDSRDIISFAQVYLAISLVMTCGVYLSYLGYEWDVLRSVGEGLFAFSPDGQFLVLHSGFLRSPEIAAWHAATSVCLILFLLLIRRRWGLFQWFAGVSALFFLGAILLTGRRKFLVEIFLFVSIYGLLLIWFRKGAIKYAVALTVAVAGALVAFVSLLPEEFSTNIRPYYERGATVRSDARERASLMTIDSFQYVIEQNGILGSGAGTGSQGAQHFGGGAEIVGLAAEGGLAKVLAELGVPGLILFFWVIASLVRYVWAILKHVKNDDPQRAKLAFGLLSFLAANAAVYVVAHQVFGDLFILIMLGFFLGFLLAIPRMQNEPAPVQPFVNLYPAEQPLERPLPGIMRN